MKNIKLFDSELKIMDIIWENSEISAKEIAAIASKQIGWNKNTTYTIIKKLIDKNAVLRSEPNFICTPLVAKDVVCQAETKSLIDRLYNGSKKAFFASFIENDLSEEDIEELKSLIEKR